MIEGDLSGTGVFQAYADRNNTLLGLADFTTGAQAVDFNGSSFDTGTASGLFDRIDGSPFSLTGVVTATMSGGGAGNFSSYVAAAPPTAVPEPGLAVAALRVEAEPSRSCRACARRESGHRTADPAAVGPRVVMPHQRRPGPPRVVVDGHRRVGTLSTPGDWPRELRGRCSWSARGWPAPAPGAGSVGSGGSPRRLTSLIGT